MTCRRAFLLLLLFAAPVFWRAIPVLNAVNWGAGTCYGQSGQPAADAEKASFWDRLKAALNKKKAANEDWKSVTERYDLMYDWIHHEDVYLYDSLSKLGEAEWDRYQNIVSVTYDRGKDTLLRNNLAPNIKVFGWHPHWMHDVYKSYRFNLLSYIAWFSYNIDSTGKNDNPGITTAGIYGKEFNELVAMAHQKGCKVLITVTNHTQAGNRALLESPDLQKTLIDDLIRLLEAGKADGVDVNFELIPRNFKRPMTAFLQKLSERLKGAEKEYILTVDLPPYDDRGAYELPVLGDFVDLFVMTGYDYHNSLPGTDGPVAPLIVDAVTPFNIRHSVDQYLQSGLKPEKLLLALPYYGAVWASASAVPGERDPTLKFKGKISYRRLKARYCLETPGYDKTRWSSHYVKFNPDSNYYEKCWFDDSLTLSRKFDWVLQEKLAGIGIWALGFDHGYPELWNLIETKYAADTMLVYKDAYLETKYFRLSKSVSEYRSLIAVAGIFIVVFLMAGMVVALFDWRVRDVFFKNKTLRLLYALGAVGILLCIYAFYLYVTGTPLIHNPNWALFAGLLLGTGITLYISYRFEKNRSSLP